MTGVSWDWVNYLPAAVTLAALLLLAVLFLEWRFSRAIKRHDERLVQAVKDERRWPIPDEEVAALRAEYERAHPELAQVDNAPLLLDVQWFGPVLDSPTGRPYINGSPEVERP